MESLTQKYTIVQLLEPMGEGDEYAPADWPLHVTLADIFAVEGSIDALFPQLAALVAGQKSFSTTAGQDEWFGPQQRTQVTILAMNDALIRLHQDIVSLLKRNGGTFNTPQFIEAGFRAHATVRPHVRLQKGDIVQFNALTIIDMFPDSNPHSRRVLKTIPFRG